ncbi:hypothetical protein TNCV_4036041 [Trichonephila clavipes]|nr:hypothetical protein TNCV_4036041 [Trichonephila clavipes]
MRAESRMGGGGCKTTSVCTNISMTLDSQLGDHDESRFGLQHQDGRIRAHCIEVNAHWQCALVIIMRPITLQDG